MTPDDSIVVMLPSHLLLQAVLGGMVLQSTLHKASACIRVALLKERLKGFPSSDPWPLMALPERETSSLTPFLISFPWESQTGREMATAAMYVAVPCPKACFQDV